MLFAFDSLGISSRDDVPSVHVTIRTLGDAFLKTDIKMKLFTTHQTNELVPNWTTMNRVFEHTS